VDFAKALHEYPVILMEGALLERLRREYQVTLDPFVYHAGFIYDRDKRSILQSLYRQYIDSALHQTTPILITTPTWRANEDRLEQSEFRGMDVNGDCVRFLQDVRKEYHEFSSLIYIGGVMGCRGDAYDASDALSTQDAYDFHGPQAARLAEAGADFLFGVTLPAVSEAMGLARAMAQTGTGYILSFVIRSDGKLLDGTLLHDAIAQIDATVSPRPLSYMINCVHPSNLLQALEVQENCSALVRSRLIGIQANASAKSPEELDGADQLAADDLGEWVTAMERLREQQLRVFGGCCGTDDRYIERLAQTLV